MAMQSNRAEQAVVSRPPPGGKQTVVLGDDSAAWGTTSNAHKKFDTEVAMQAATPGPRKPPGGVDSVQLGGPVEAVAAEELLARPSPGGEDSIAFGKDAGDSLPAAQLLARASPGGTDSVDFSSSVRNLSSEALMARPWPGGSATVVLGGDNPQWTTNSQAHGVGSAEAAAAVEARVRPAPGGVDSINFTAEEGKVSSDVLLARPSPGGADSVDFSAVESTLSSQQLLVRPYPGGSTTVVLGGDSNPQWTTNSQTHGIGSAEAIAAAEATTRRAPGGADSINFGQVPSSLSSEVLLARPSPGGETEITLGGDNIDWKTNSSTLGAGSVEAIAQAEPRCRPPPGGADSVESINSAPVAASVTELLARPHTGGKASILLGGDSADWITSSGTHGTGDTVGNHVVEAVMRQAPGGVDSVDFGGMDACTLTVGELLARPAPGGADSVDFGRAESSNLAAADLLVRPSPGGATNVILGSDDGAWATTSQNHNGTSGANDAAVQGLRPPPGGVDSVVIAGPQENAPSVEALLARPACGGAATVVLGGDASTWATCGSVLGVGCADAAATASVVPGAADSIDFTKGNESIIIKPKRVMCPAGEGTATLVLGDDGVCPELGVSANRFACGSNQNQGNWITDRSTTRLHQAPGGNSSIDLGDGSASKAPTSANRFACGSNQNQGNWMTDRSTTKLHQAPGGNSTINLGDDSAPPVVGAQVSRFAKAGNSNTGGNSNVGIKVQYAPGGASTLCLGQVDTKEFIMQDENVNNANVQPIVQGVMKPEVIRKAPGGDASVVLG